MYIYKKKKKTILVGIVNKDTKIENVHKQKDAN